MEDLTGRDVGYWHVICYAGNVHNRPYFACLCTCGVVRIVNGSSLKRGKSSSCGCMTALKMREKSTVRTHGLSLHPLYLNVYSSLKQRCSDPKMPCYKNYGARGIKLCDEWANDFTKFYDWMIGHGWYAGCNLTIDRIDPDGNYCPENCRLASHKEQANNRRCTIFLTLNGEKKSISEWSEICGISYNTLRSRKKACWTDEKILTTPVNIKYSTKHKSL